jgi:hypothetical protein
MSEDVGSAENVLEGQVQTPEARSKVFNSARELGEYLSMTNPRVIQVVTTQEGKYVLSWRVE